MTPITSRIFFILFKLFFFIIPLGAAAAPAPGMGSSILSSLKQSVFTRAQGFQVQIEDTTWKAPEVNMANNWLDGQLTFKSQTHPEAKLNLRHEQLHRATSLENYAKKWMRDYTGYGFEILGTRGFTQDKTRGLVVDLKQNAKNQMLRQVLFIQDQKVVLFTFADTQENFSKSLSDFNNVIRSFSWEKETNSEKTF